MSTHLIPQGAKGQEVKAFGEKVTATRTPQVNTYVRNHFLACILELHSDSPDRRLNKGECIADISYVLFYEFKVCFTMVNVVLYYKLHTVILFWQLCSPQTNDDVSWMEKEQLCIQMRSIRECASSKLLHGYNAMKEGSAGPT